ncbi:hypothetical protein DUNSADRAFT_13540 [Dunaliella salina]|uniref:Encoded protein n=1 Tax=Dunaliella salina TaxID=3046 RepID=A0ABQ7G950_DUNSA|nr:hypothetical protein DUNSADRAFT_13540 [Dunaliella salina]|eukprot:KAF5831137.1 hypothetical protein DUNSADRAFT_13540 [Dunaliella salina]
MHFDVLVEEFVSSPKRAHAAMFQRGLASQALSIFELQRSMTLSETCGKPCPKCVKIEKRAPTRVGSIACDAAEISKACPSLMMSVTNPLCAAY